MPFLKNIDFLWAYSRHKMKLFLVICSIFVACQYVSAQGSRSVVRIRVDNRDAGTGFVYYSPKHVVTALHVVAGRDNIMVISESNGEKSPATVYKVHKESDLVLLKLARGLGLPALQHNVKPVLSQEHTVWGYPRNVATKQGDPIRFSKSEYSNPTLDHILKSGDKIKTQLHNQGYPSPSVSILRVGSIIQPGHSGAPIMNKADQVVGIADGGLYGGTARINWAIHAKYLPILANNRSDKHPTRPSLQSQLFGNQNPLIQKSVARKFAHNKELYYVRTVSLGETYDLLPRDDQESLDYQLSEFSSNWRYVYIDIYEDYRTGATISVPEGSYITYDVQKEWFHIKSGNLYEMFIQVKERNSWDDAIAAKNSFVNSLGRLKNWTVGPTSDSVENVDRKFSYYNANVSWETYHDRNRESQKSQMSASLDINDNNFFGTAYLANDIQEIEFDDYYLLNICVQLASFAIN